MYGTNRDLQPHQAGMRTSSATTTLANKLNGTKGPRRNPLQTIDHFVLPDTKSPLARLHNPKSIKFSRRTEAHLAKALRHGWAPSTLKGYNGAVNWFVKFCKKERVHPRFWLPAEELVLCAFAASSEGIHAGSTARNSLAGLKAWHVAQNAEWKGGKQLSYVLNGVENRRPSSSFRTPRLPVNRNMLRILRSGLDLSDHVDMAIFAAACVAFWGQCCLGEILLASTTPAAVQRVPKRADFAIPSPSSPSHIIHLPSTKTKFSRGEDVVILSQQGSSDPIRALRHHLYWNGPSNSSHLFAYKTSFGSRPLTRRFFMRRCNAIWSQAGLPRFTGHSFRIGGTTELLLAGVSPDIIKKASRWASDAFLRYWRVVEGILSPHMQLLPSDRPRQYRRRPRQQVSGEPGARTPSGCGLGEP